jgi:hypothetical protein
MLFIKVITHLLTNTPCLTISDAHYAHTAHKLFINLQTIEERAALEEEVTRLRRTLDSQRSAAADAAALAAGAAARAADELRSVRARLDAAEAQLQPIREALTKEQVYTTTNIHKISFHSCLNTSARVSVLNSCNIGHSSILSDTVGSSGSSSTSSSRLVCAGLCLVVSLFHSDYSIIFQRAIMAQ